MNSRLHICLTCVRDLPLAAGEASRGRQLLEAVRERLSQLESSPGFELRTMHCLNGCRNPCNVAYRGAGKYSLRFSRLTAADAEAVLEFAAAYCSSPDGSVPEEDWPAALRGKLSARTTPPQVLLGSATAAKSDTSAGA